MVKMSISTDEDDDSLLFIDALILDGFTLKNALKILQNVCESGKIYFTPYSINIGNYSQDNNCYVDINIDCAKLYSYVYNVSDAEGDMAESMDITVNYKDLYKCVANVAKKNGIALRVTDKGIVYLMIIEAEGNMVSSKCKLNVQPFNTNTFKIPQYSEIYHNVCVKSKNFDTMISNLKACLCGTIKVICRKYSIGFIGYNESGSSINNVTYGDVEKDEEPIVTVVINFSFFYNFQKIHMIGNGSNNLSHFYFEEEKPIKWYCSISNYGSMIIYINNVDI